MDWPILISLNNRKQRIEDCPTRIKTCIAGQQQQQQITLRRYFLSKLEAEQQQNFQTVALSKLELFAKSAQIVLRRSFSSIPHRPHFAFLINVAQSK